MNSFLLILEEGVVGKGVEKFVPRGILAFSGRDVPFVFVTSCALSVICCFNTMFGTFDVVNTILYVDAYHRFVL